MGYSKITLITGVAGTTGSAILDLLSETEEVKSGERIIVGVDNLFRGNIDNICSHLPEASFIFLQKNFQDFYNEKVDLSFIDVSKIDEIYHMAAVVPTKYFYEAPEMTFRENCVGTIDLFNWALSKGIKRFIVGSTSEVYGHIREEDLPANESTMSHFDSVESSTRWSYAEGKLLTEHVLNKSADRIKVCHLRFANTYGVRDMDDNHVIPYLVNHIARNQDIEINSRPDEFRRTFLNNKDAARACIELMKSGRTGTAYNVGSTEEVTILQLIDVIIGVCKELISDFEYTGKVNRTIDRPGDPMRRLLTSERLGLDTGFFPQVSLKEGITEMVNEVLKKD